MQYFLLLCILPVQFADTLKLLYYSFWFLLIGTVINILIYLPFILQQVPPEVETNSDRLLLNDRNKYKSMLIRTYSTFWMIGGFIAIIYLGHLYIWAMVVVIQIFMAKELFNLLRKAHEDKQLPGFRLLNWWMS